jgi:hypothetical protein
MSASQRHSPLFTAMVVLAVGAAVFREQIRERGGIDVGSAFWNIGLYSHGWPTSALRRTVTAIGNTIVETDDDWSPWGVFVNVASTLILLVGTTIACQLWCRRAADWWQFSLRDLLAFLSIAAILLALWQNDVWLSQQLAARIGTSAPYLNGGIRYEPWYVQVPILFGLGCVIYSAGWMATKFLLAMRCRVGV